MAQIDQDRDVLDQSHQNESVRENVVRAFALHNWFPFGVAVFGLLAVFAFVSSADSPEPIASYSETNYGKTTSLNDIRSGTGQVFTPRASANLHSSRFYLSREKSPTGTMVSKLYTVTGTPGLSAVPTGAPLAVSSVLDVSTLSKWPNMALVTFDFTADSYLMSAGVPYAIVVEYTGGSSTNTIPMGKSNSGTHPGNKFDLESGRWIGESGLDLIFYVYGDAVDEAQPGNLEISSQQDTD